MPRTQEMDGAEVPEALHEWQQIPSPLPQNTPTEHQFGLGWESETAPVVVGDNYLNPNDDGSIFPTPDLQSPEDPNSEGDDEEENQRLQVGIWSHREALEGAVWNSEGRCLPGGL